MRLRLYLVFWLGLFLASCDKQPKSQKNPGRDGETEAPPKITKSQQSPREEFTTTREKERESLEEAKRISSAEERNQALAGIAWNNLEADPQLALEAFQQLAPGSTERVRLIQHFTMRLAEQDIEQAIKWAASLENAEESSLAYGRISIVLSATDPARAANLISESGMAGREFDVAVVQVIQRWAATAPADAAAWVVLFDPGTARHAGIQNVVSLWAKTDMPAALTWIGGLQDEALRQEARSAMAESILQQPPEVQTEWLRTASPEIRAEVDKLKVPSGGKADD